jgi:hypothetical protein
MNRRISGRAGLVVAGLWLVCLGSLALTLIAGGVVSSRLYGGVVPAYSTLSSGFWWGFTQTAGAPASQTAHVFYGWTSTAGVPASMTADVYWHQTGTAGVVPSMTGQAAFEQTGTAGYIPGLTEQAQWGLTLTAGVPATATANAIATQGAP